MKAGAKAPAFPFGKRCTDDKACPQTIILVTFDPIQKIEIDFFHGNVQPTSQSKMKKVLLTLTTISVIASNLLADVVYITARPNPSGAGENLAGGYDEISATGSDTSAVGTGTGVPARSGCRFFFQLFFKHKLRSILSLTRCPFDSYSRSGRRDLPD
jgi:hypothetical protein